MTTVERSVEIRNRHGLHARPAAEFVKLASGYGAKIQVSKDDLQVNGKSIMGVLMLAAEPGSSITIRAEGEDAAEAVDALVEFVRTDSGAELEDLAAESVDEVESGDEREEGTG